MAPHSSTLAWKIPWTEKPGGLQSMGSRRVGHDWGDLAAAAAAAVKWGWPKPKQGVRGSGQDPSALVHPNNPCFTVKSGRSQATGGQPCTLTVAYSITAPPRPCKASVSSVPWGQPHNGAKGGSKRQEGVRGFGEQSRAETLFCSSLLEMFYEACCHTRVSWSFKWIILRVKGCYVLVTQGQWTYPECPRQTRV